MPELPEVETIKESVKKVFEGSIIESVKVYNRHLRINVPDNFEKTVSHAKIMRIYRIAKYAIMDLDNDYSIIWHFGMSGKIKIVKESDFTLEKHDHIIVKTNKGVLIYNDPRRFGLVTIAKTLALAENPIFAHTGIDPFNPNLSKKYLFEKLRNKKVPIKLALLDQSIIAGIGNIYASEALFMTHISPLRESNSLKLNEIDTLIKSIRIVLKKAIDAGGSTLHDYKKPDGDIGYFQFQHCVYGKDGKDCLNCKPRPKNCVGIKKIVQAGRSTFYCPILQK